MTRIKICGVTLPDDAAAVASAGVDFIGLNFWPKSKRYLAPERAPMIAGIARSMNPNVKLVGVFVDAAPEEILAVAARVELDVIQLHGDEDPETCRKISLAVYRPVWKAVTVASSRDVERLDMWPAEAILLDAPGVLAKHARPEPGAAARDASVPRLDPAVAREARERHPGIHIVLAGGLEAANVAQAVRTVEPWAVDVASGVEAAPGVKDREKVLAFVAAVRSAV